MICAITAYDTKQTFEKAYAVGIAKCLTKPVKPDMLAFLVEYHNRMSGHVIAEAANDEFNKPDPGSSPTKLTFSD
eukprot:CAMPEP_0170451812 /NCGR_PEP_ID=MMETSP0123-20130129/936_1 /TAXON_ID=182087 /ORGANISM="Favella ehrenbergii, Strain Fehren 1" /LENGTH=74 /DNA_ID=CAMNT_0010713643 /DNA_START=1360 /DNA_END=1582 /DNA_ORIENTATION=+